MSKGKILQFFHKDAKKLNTISDDTIPLPDIHSKKSKAGTQTNVHTHVPGSTTHSSQKAGQPECPSAEDCGAHCALHEVLGGGGGRMGSCCATTPSPSLGPVKVQRMHNSMNVLNVTELHALENG